MTDQLLQRGDVVACGGRYFVAWKLSPCEIEAFPILLGAERFFPLYAVDVLNELADWGITERRGVVSVGEHETISRVPPLKILRVGRCSGGLICRVVAGATRAFAAQFVADVGRGECNNNSPSRVVVASI